MWRDAWWLTKKEIKHHWPAFIYTFLAVILIALLASRTLEAFSMQILGDNHAHSNTLLLDLIFVGLTPSFAALFMSVPYLSLRTIREDPFSKMMEEL